MSSPISRRRIALLLIVLFGVGARPYAAQAQRQYANRVTYATNTGSPENALGNIPGTQATLAPPTVLGRAALRLGLPTTGAAGSRAGLIVNAGGALTAAALNNVIVRTYLAPSTQPQQELQLSQLLSLTLLNAGQATAEFTTTTAFDQLELEANGLVNAYTLGLVAAYSTVAPLPVELVGFRGQAGPGGVQLSWQTASELHNAYFAIERAATPEQEEFRELGRVAGAGSSAQARSYAFVDAAPEPLGYYRLRQVDSDGQAHYSPVVAVAPAPGTGLSVYPNPAATTLFVAGPSGAALHLFNQQGQLLRQATLGAGQQALDVSSLPPGIYYVRDATSGQRTRFVKAAR